MAKARKLEEILKTSGLGKSEAESASTTSPLEQGPTDGSDFFDPDTGEPYNCLICMDVGRVHVQREPGDLVGPTSRVCDHIMAQQEWVPDTAFYKAARIATTFRGLTIETWGEPDEEACKVATGYTATWPPEKPLLLFIGKSGTKKTGMATSILTEVYRTTGQVGGIWTVRQMLDRFYASMDNDSDESPNLVLRIFKRLPLLVLDQYGMEEKGESDYQMQRIFEVLDDRWSNQTPLIIITDQPLDMMKDRNWSRMQDGNVSTVVEFIGDDRRVR